MKRDNRSVVTTRGRVTIPREIRRRLGIEPGTRLRFSVEGEKLVAVNESPSDPVSRVYGILGTGDTDAIMRKLRGGR